MAETRERRPLGPEIRFDTVDNEAAIDGIALPTPGRRGRRWPLRVIVLGYLTFLLILPVALVVYRTFEHGLEPIFRVLTDEDFLHAVKVTIIVAGVAVVLNTIFGLIASFLLVRHDFPGKRVFDKLIDLPLAVSPVVVGLALILVYGVKSPIGAWFDDYYISIIYAYPGMIMATCFVSLPLVVREVAPILEEVGDEQEQAAATLGASSFQTFRRVTLPSIKWGLAYGVILTLARCLGEFGAVAVVSGKIKGETQTMTLFVEQSFDGFDKQGAFTASFALAAIAVIALLLMNVFRPKEDA